jgi:ABC-type Na+ transport system ATPase subunit NatA
VVRDSITNSAELRSQSDPVNERLSRLERKLDQLLRINETQMQNKQRGPEHQIETMEVAGSILPGEMIKITDRAFQGITIKITEKILEFLEKLSALFAKVQVTLKPNAFVNTISRKTKQD